MVTNINNRQSSNVKSRVRYRGALPEPDGRLAGKRRGSTLAGAPGRRRQRNNSSRYGSASNSNVPVSTAATYQRFNVTGLSRNPKSAGAKPNSEMNCSQ